MNTILSNKLFDELYELNKKSLGEYPILLVTHEPGKPLPAGERNPSLLGYLASRLGACPGSGAEHGQPKQVI